MRIVDVPRDDVGAVKQFLKELDGPPTSDQAQMLMMLQTRGANVQAVRRLLTPGAARPANNVKAKRR